MDGRSRRKKVVDDRYCIVCGNKIVHNTKKGENRINLTQYSKAKFCSKKCKGKDWSLQIKGKNNFNWKHGKSKLWEIEKGSWKYKKWRQSIFLRDKYTCKICGITGGNLNAHHIKKFKDYPKDRYKLENGITLCEDCHYIIHNK
jgi:hypothetical protein